MNSQEEAQKSTKTLEVRGSKGYFPCPQRRRSLTSSSLCLLLGVFVVRYVMEQNIGYWGCIQKELSITCSCSDLGVALAAFCRATDASWEKVVGASKFYSRSGPRSAGPRFPEDLLLNRVLKKVELDPRASLTITNTY